MYLITCLNLMKMPKKNPKHQRKSLTSDLETDDPKKKVTRLMKTCSVKGCKEESVHALSVAEYGPSVKGAGLELKPLKGSRRFRICKIHYKKIKKLKKKNEKLLKPSRFQDSGKKMKSGKIQSRLE